MKRIPKGCWVCFVNELYVLTSKGFVDGYVCKRLKVNPVSSLLLFVSSWSPEAYYWITPHESDSRKAKFQIEERVTTDKVDAFLTLPCYVHDVSGKTTFDAYSEHRKYEPLAIKMSSTAGSPTNIKASALPTAGIQHFLRCIHCCMPKCNQSVQ